MSYASETTVAAERSRAEIERTLARYGATNFMYGWDDGRAVIVFKMGEKFGYRQVRFILTMPLRETFRLTPGGRRRRNDTQVEAAFEQATRQRWRALLLVVKAKLEAVESEISNFDEEFLSHIMLPNGETVGDWLADDLDEAYRSGEMPNPLRLALPAGDPA